MGNALRRVAITAAPTVVAFSLIAGNAGLLLRRGLHPNFETAAGLVWIASDYALRQKRRHPVAAPRINAAGVVLGSLLIAASGVHAHWVDWHRVRTPLGYVPAACIIGFQKELRTVAIKMSNSANTLIPIVARVLRRPFAMAALVNAYGVCELARSAWNANDRGLLAISACYALATVALPFLDADQVPHAS